MQSECEKSESSTRRVARCAVARSTAQRTRQRDRQIRCCCWWCCAGRRCSLPGARVAGQSRWSGSIEQWRRPLARPLLRGRRSTARQGPDSKPLSSRPRVMQTTRRTRTRYRTAHEHARDSATQSHSDPPHCSLCRSTPARSPLGSRLPEQTAVVRSSSVPVLVSVAALIPQP